MYREFFVSDPKAKANELVNKLFIKGYKSKVVFNEQKNSYVVLILRNDKWVIFANIGYKTKKSSRKITKKITRSKKSKPKSLYGW